MQEFFLIGGRAVQFCSLFHSTSRKTLLFLQRTENLRRYVNTLTSPEQCEREIEIEHYAMHSPHSFIRCFCAIFDMSDFHIFRTTRPFLHACSPWHSITPPFWNISFPTNVRKQGKGLIRCGAPLLDYVKEHSVTKRCSRVVC